MKNNYLISKIAELTGTTKDAIRFYEKKGLFFAKIKSENNYRYYDDESLARLTFIKNCRNVGLSIQEIQILLEEMGQQKKNCNEVNHLIDRHISELDKKILQLQDFRSDLLEIRQKCNENTDIDHCLILKELSLKK